MADGLGRPLLEEGMNRDDRGALSREEFARRFGADAAGMPAAAASLGEVSSSSAAKLSAAMRPLRTSFLNLGSDVITFFQIIWTVPTIYRPFGEHTWDEKDAQTPGRVWREWLTDELIKKMPTEVQQEVDEGTKVTNFQFSGPAILEIWHATLVQWIFALAFPFFVVTLSHCPRGLEPFAHYPTYVWLLYLPVVVYTIRCEVKALGWMMMTFAQYCAPFKLFGKTLSSGSWLWVTGAFSLATHADIVTNGLFLAKIIKTALCGSNTFYKTEELWKRVIRESTVRWIPFFDNFYMLLVFCWAIMFIQPLICVFYAFPLCGQSVSYAARSMKKGYRTLWTVVCRTGTVWHADCLKMLATVNRMTSLTDKSLDWCIQRANEELRSEKEEKNKHNRAFDMVNLEFARMVHRLYLVNLLEKAFMLEAQSALFVISRALQPRDQGWRIDWQMALSLFFSFLCFMKIIVDAICQHLMIKGLWDTKLYSLDLGEAQICRCLGTEKKHHLRWTWLCFLCGIFLLFCFLIHCIAKIIMAFACEDSLWDLPLGNQPDTDWKGCVDLSDILSNPLV